MRQRPASAKGTTFVTLEDETGNVNVIIRPDLAARHRLTLMNARLLHVCGVMQRTGSVTHCLAGRIRDASALLGDLDTRSRDFH